MPNGKVTLGYLRMQAKQRADMENNPAISDTEWNGYLSLSYKELYDKLVAAYGNDYYIAQPYQFSLTGSQFYPLPDGSTTYLSANGSTAPAFYKLCGVDLQYSGSPSGWVSLRNFNWVDRNKYAYPNTTVNINGYSNLRYRISDNSLWLIPIPATSQLAQLWYVPEPTSIQFSPSCALTSSSASVTAVDVGGLSVGMSVYGTGIPLGTSILAINTTTRVITLSAAATVTSPYATVTFWVDSTLIDGIAGWEEYVIIDAAIKAQIKQENDITGLSAQLQKMSGRLDSMAEGRDMGMAAHVSDALSLNGYGDGDDDGGWFGGGSGWGGY